MARQQQRWHFPSSLLIFHYRLVTQHVHYALCQFPDWLYLLFLSVQALQILSFAHLPPLIYHSYGADYFGSLVKFVTLEYVMRNIGDQLMHWVIAVFAVATIIHITLAVVCFHLYKQGSQWANRVAFLINILTLSSCTFLTIPCIQTTLYAFTCLPPYLHSQTCYQQSTIAFLVLASLVMLWNLFLNVLIARHSFQLNPFCQGYSGCSSGSWNSGKLIAKIWPIIYQLVSPQLQPRIVYVNLLPGVYLIYLSFYRLLSHYYHYGIALASFVIRIEALTIVVLLAGLPLSLLQTEDKNVLFCFSWAVGVIAGEVFSHYSRWTKQELMKSMCDAEKEQVPAVIESIIYYLQLAETNVEEKGYVPMLDLLMRHHEDCQQPSCECRTLLLVYKEQHQEWNGIRQAYQLVICILDNFIVHNRRITLPYILKFFVLMKLGLTVRAAATASRVLSLNLQELQRVTMYEQLSNLLMANPLPQEVKDYPSFCDSLEIIEDKCLLVCEAIATFWQELINQHSSLNKLEYLLGQVAEARTVIVAAVTNALEIFPNHPRILTVYGGLMQEVLGSTQSTEWCRLPQGQGTTKEKIFTGPGLKFRQHENLTVITIARPGSIDKSYNWFVILKASFNIFDLLGYLPNSLHLQPLNSLLPRSYHMVHDNLLSRILDRGGRRLAIHGSLLHIFPVDKRGHLVQCLMEGCWMCSIEYGITGISFIKRKSRALKDVDNGEAQMLLIYQRQTGLVDAMDQKAYDILHPHQNDKESVTVQRVEALLPQWSVKNQAMRNLSEECKISSRPLRNSVFRHIRAQRSQHSDQITILRLVLGESAPLLGSSVQVMSHDKYLDESVAELNHAVLQLENVPETKKNKLTMENESSAVVLSSRTLTREVAKHWKYFLIVVQVGCCCILVILLSLITSSCYQKYGTIKTLISQYQLSQQVSAIFLHAPYSLSLLYSLQTQGDFGSDRSKESLLLANLTAENRLLQVFLPELFTATTVPSQIIINITRDTGTIAMSLDSASYSYATALLWMLNDYNTPHSVNLGSHQRDVFRNADQILKGYSTLSAQLLAKGENDLRDQQTRIAALASVCCLVFACGCLSLLLFVRQILAIRVAVCKQCCKVNVSSLQAYVDNCLNYRATTLQQSESKATHNTNEYQIHNNQQPEQPQEGLEQQCSLIVSELGWQKTVLELPERIHYVSFEGMPTIKDTCFPIFVSSLAFLVLQVCLLLLSRAATNDLAHSLTVLDQYHQLRNAAAYVRSGVLDISNVYNYWSEPQIVNIARSVHTAITDCELLLRDSDLQTQHLRVLLTAQLDNYKAAMTDLLNSQSHNSPIDSSVWSRLCELFDKMDQALTSLEAMAAKCQSALQSSYSRSQNSLLVYTLVLLLLTACYFQFLSRRVYLGWTVHHNLAYELYLMLLLDIKKVEAAVPFRHQSKPNIK